MAKSISQLCNFAIALLCLQGSLHCKIEGVFNVCMIYKWPIGMAVTQGKTNNRYPEKC